MHEQQGGFYKIVVSGIKAKIAGRKKMIWAKTGWPNRERKKRRALGGRPHSWARPSSEGKQAGLAGHAGPWHSGKGQRGRDEARCSRPGSRGRRRRRTWRWRLPATRMGRIQVEATRNRARARIRRRGFHSRRRNGGGMHRQGSLELRVVRT